MPSPIEFEFHLSTFWGTPRKPGLFLIGPDEIQSRSSSFELQTSDDFGAGNVTASNLKEGFSLTCLIALSPISFSGVRWSPNFFQYSLGNTSKYVVFPRFVSAVEGS